MEPFSLRAWLQEQDATGADETLSEGDARLFALNQQLLHPHAGPILALNILRLPDSEGIALIASQAQGPEPRFAVMALVGILYILRDISCGADLAGGVEMCTISDDGSRSEASEGAEDGEDGEDVTDATDADKEEDEAAFVERYARGKVAGVIPLVVELYLQNEGDYACGDFVTYLLTLLLDLRRTHHSVRTLATPALAKRFMQVWKHASVADHVTDDKAGFSAGFLVTCYVGAAPAESIAGLGAWAVKFFTLRLYSAPAERAQVMRVMWRAAGCSEDFSECLRTRAVVTALAHMCRGVEKSSGDETCVLAALLKLCVRSSTCIPGLKGALEGLRARARQGNVGVEGVQRCVEASLGIVAAEAEAAAAAAGAGEKTEAGEGEG